MKSNQDKTEKWSSHLPTMTTNKKWSVWFKFLFWRLCFFFLFIFVWGFCAYRQRTQVRVREWEKCRRIGQLPHRRLNKNIFCTRQQKFEFRPFPLKLTKTNSKLFLRQKQKIYSLPNKSTKKMFRNFKFLVVYPPWRCIGCCRTWPSPWWAMNGPCCCLLR